MHRFGRTVELGRKLAINIRIVEPAFEGLESALLEELSRNTARRGVTSLTYNSSTLSTGSVTISGGDNGARQNYSTAHSARNATMDRILVIEDDRAVRKVLKHLFQTEGFTVDLATDGVAGMTAFRAAQPSVVILDLKLPGISGRDICREIKNLAPQVPVIVLSAASDVMDKVVLLELGADDYVTKPFSPRELLARVRAAMRRTTRGAGKENVYTFDSISVDFAKMELIKAGQQVTLSAQEFKILKFMLQNPERVLTRDELLNEVWGYQNYPTTRTVDNHVFKLRQKLEKDPSNPVHFRTVHSSGYKFIP